MTPPTIFVDARCLQDPGYRSRGVGQHSSALIEALRRHRWAGKRPRIVALTNATLEPINAEQAWLFDEIQVGPDVGRAAIAEGVWFISLSPMTHDPTWVGGLLTNPAVYRVCLFYDLIPLAYPERYLARPEAAADYLVGMAWLARFDAFASISAFSQAELVRHVGIDPSKVFVSGVAVRTALLPQARDKDVPLADRKWVVVAGGGDARKNPECAIRAHARSQKLQKAGIGLALFGSYGPDDRAAFRDFYAKHGGRAEQLKIFSHLDDEELRQVYRTGLVTVVPSFAEGFSIPIVESSAAATPVLTSDVGAHPELTRDSAWRFDPEDSKALQALLERLLAKPADWASLRAAQQNLWRDYTVDIVGGRFLKGILARAPKLRSGPAILKPLRPSIAVLTPLPPSQSGVADYSGATISALGEFADVHIFTNTPNAKLDPRYATVSPLEAVSYTSRSFDASVSVIGNSHFHTDIFDYLMVNGGACLAHDARMADFYYHLKGPDRAAKVASAELGEDVTAATVESWLSNPRQMKTLFLSEMVKASSTFMVHSPTTARILEETCDAKPSLLPFAQYRPMPKGIGSKPAMVAARERLGVENDEILLVTFGGVQHDRAPGVLVWALRMLQMWGLKARLTFCGVASDPMAAMVMDLARQASVEDRVLLYKEPVSDRVYNDYLLASDAAIQLRTYAMGGLSGALNDCIAASLPSVANEHLADALMAPDFVRRIPDSLSSVLVAEAVLDILSSGQNKTRPTAKAVAYHRAHSLASYARKMMNALGFEA